MVYVGLGLKFVLIRTIMVISAMLQFMDLRVPLDALLLGLQLAAQVGLGQRTGILIFLEQEHMLQQV
jgi:hypothetical protein